MREADVFLIAAARGQGQVHGRPEPRSAPRFVETPGAGVVRKLVHRQVENGRIVLKGVLGPVSVVNVPVENQDLVQTQLRLEGPSGDGHVVQEAKAHGAACFSVVARGPDRGDSVAGLPSSHAQGEVDGAPRGQLGDLEAAARDIGVRVELGGRPGGCLLDQPIMIPAMNPQDLLLGGFPGRHALQISAVAIQCPGDGGQSLGPFRVTGGRFVALKAEILDDVNQGLGCGHGKRTYPMRWSLASPASPRIGPRPWD